MTFPVGGQGQEVGKELETAESHRQGEALLLATHSRSRTIDGKRFATLTWVKTGGVFSPAAPTTRCDCT